MSDNRPSFPLHCLDIREAAHTGDPHYVIVLNGTSTPPGRPIISQGEVIATATVDVQGLWGEYEWSLLPQKLDASSPWLAFIPIYGDPHHLTRSTIHNSMMIQKEREKAPGSIEKEPLLFRPEEELKKRIWDYVKEVTQRAQSTIQVLQQAEIGADTRIVWPAEAIQRATYLYRLLIAGVPSRNSFKRAISSMRRAVLELEGFDIWAAIVTAPTRDQTTVSRNLRTERMMSYRGAFLDGTVDEWLDSGSDVRRMYARMLQCDAPTYSWVRKSDWNMGAVHALRTGTWPFVAGLEIEGAHAVCISKDTRLTGSCAIEREERQLRFYCYPPKVPGTLFERAARGLSEHSEEGQQGAIDRFGELTARRGRTQCK